MARELRDVLGDVAGRLEYVTALLSHAEHSPARATISRVRATLSEQASTLHVARAHLTAQERTER